MGRPLNRPLPKWCTISVGSSDGMAPRVSNDLVSDGQVMSKIREGKLPSRIHQESGRGGKSKRKEKKGRNKKNRKIQWGTFDGKPFSIINMPSTKKF